MDTLKRFKLIEVIKQNFNNDDMIKESNSLLYGVKHLVEDFFKKHYFTQTTTINEKMNFSYIFDNGLEITKDDVFEVSFTIMWNIKDIITDNIEGKLSKTDFNRLNKFIESVDTIYTDRYDMSLGRVDRLFLYFFREQELTDYIGDRYKRNCDFYNNNFEFFNKFAGTNFEKLKYTE